MESYDLAICDECHHAAAPQMELVLKAVRAKYVYGLSATPKRADGLDRALFVLRGPIRCRINPKEHARRLAEIIEQENTAEAHVLVGEGTARQKREKIVEAISAVSDRPAAIVATESYLGEGFDAAALDALFLATPFPGTGT